MDCRAARKIIHVDMDAFYASVEIRDRPDLAGQPVVVGGRPDSRGVVAAASYEARKYGIHSAMPSARAYKACPQVVFLPPDFEKYRAVSRHIHEIFRRHTDLVEPLSLDEAYLDVTQHRDGIPSATWIAQRIKGEIFDETALTASAGVAPNKFLAKIASDEKKPDGLFVIRPQDVAPFLVHLPLAKVPGIGRATQEAFNAMQIRTCGQLQKLPLALLTHKFGKRGAYFHQIARGIDEREVKPHRTRKSVGIEDTFAEDHADASWLHAKLGELARGLERRLRSAGVKGRTLTLKVRFADFHTLTRSRTLAEYMDEREVLLACAQELFGESGAQGRKVRLLGISLHNLDNAPNEPWADDQLSFHWTDEG